jgi:hypothetical protein
MVRRDYMIRVDRVRISYYYRYLLHILYSTTIVYCVRLFRVFLCVS